MPWTASASTGAAGHEGSRLRFPRPPGLRRPRSSRDRRTGHPPRVKRRPVKNDGGLAIDFPLFDDPGVELGQIRVLVVKLPRAGTGSSVPSASIYRPSSVEVKEREVRVTGRPEAGPTRSGISVDDQFRRARKHRFAPA